MLKRLYRFNLYVNLKKYEFFIIKIELLNFIMFIDNVLMNKYKIKTIQKWSKSKSYYDI